ncbi:MAG: hypothetical protein GSR72_07015 [Desulfurococcales archaeon]|nr:hypothetical protein [Desulfurococcales archaeon]
MKKLYRIYYNTFDADLHEKVKKLLEERYKAKIVEHKSMLHPDFRYLELYVDTPGLEEEISNLVKTILGSIHVKVDWIDTSK